MFLDICLKTILDVGEAVPPLFPPGPCRFSSPLVESLEGTKGVPRNGAVGNSWFDCILLSIRYMFKPLF